MTAKKFYNVMVGVLFVAIGGAIAMLYFGNSLMQKSSDQLVGIKLDNISLDTEEQSYLQARKDLDKYKDFNAIIQKVLPKSKDQAQAVAELYKIGDETKITIEKIQFPNSTLGQKSAATTTTTNNNSTTTPTTNSVTQAKPVEGLSGVLGMDISVSLLPASGSSISYDSMINFLQKVEQNRRNMQIKQITVHADTKNGGVTFELTLTIFVKP